MTTYDRGRIVDSPLVRAGLTKPFATRFGTVSHSDNQTGWALDSLRRQVPAAADLSDDDLVWLLGRGWAP